MKKWLIAAIAALLAMTTFTVAFADNTYNNGNQKTKGNDKGNNKLELGVERLLKNEKKIT